MAVLKIYKLDDQEESIPISILVEGEHVIGREKLNCNDKRVSRNHALIIITEETVKIKATHVNPTYYKPYGGNSIQLIKNNNIITLNDRDKFALLPSEFWFRIRVEKNQEFPESNRCHKRIYEEESNEEIIKKPKINEVTANVSRDSEESLDFADSLIHDTSNNRNQTDVSSSKENLDLNNSTEEKCNIDSKSQHKETSSDSETPDLEKQNEEDIVARSGESEKQNDKEETADMSDNETNLSTITKKDDETSNKDNPSTSTTKTRRDRCWYGAKCYRKNPVHRTNFSHPGDSDYDTDPEDDRLACPFGDTCYRSNITHRKQYKHLKPPAPKPVTNINQNDSNHSDDSDDDTTNKVGKVKKRKAAVKPKKYTDTPEDDYDFDDPFLNDASSDDFEISGEEESNDSDWMDSQEVDEESQETRRLLKEAKKFTKKTNKK